MNAGGPTVIVLAAGMGARFGGHGHKLAQDLNGTSVLAQTLRNAMATHLPVLAVITPALEVLARSLLATRDLVVLPEVGSAAGLGMGHSIAAGVAASASAAGWLILPADMPLIRPETIVAVGRALLESPVAYAQHAGRRGHPVGFGTELYSDLVALHGDEGARRLLVRYPAQAVDVNDPGVLMDLDTDEDLAALRQAVSLARASPF